MIFWQTSIFILLMILLVVLYNWDRSVQSGYRCAQCGTQRKGKHSKGCSYRDE